MQRGLGDERTASPRSRASTSSTRVPPTPLPQLWELHACFEKADDAITRTDATELKDRLEKLARRTRTSRRTTRARPDADDFYDSLPRVRRALANVPTYMVFDDHDVTDDWNIGRAWRDRVHTSPLGRRIITNALVAYALFQDWGNDPLRYRKDPFGRARPRLRHQPLARANPGDTMPVGSTSCSRGCSGSTSPIRRTPPPQLKWHCSVDGPRHRVIVLDTRTRRSFRSRYLPPGLLSSRRSRTSSPTRVTPPLPAGMDMLVVDLADAARPARGRVRGHRPAEGAHRRVQARTRWRRLTGLEPDNEIWPGDEVAYEAVLQAARRLRKVVVLSGEVHCGAAAS